MQENIPTGISFKKDLISKIDSERGDIPRSKYIQRILERYYLLQEPRKEEEKNLKFDSSDSTTAAKQKEGSDESLANT